MLQRRPVLLLAVGLRLTSLAPLFQLLLQQCGLTHKTTQQGQCREFLVPVEFRQRQLLETSFKPSDLVGARWCAVNGDRKSTRLNSSHVSISYAVFCLKKKSYLNQA